MVWGAVSALMVWGVRATIRRSGERFCLRGSLSPGMSQPTAPWMASDTTSAATFVRLLSDKLILRFREIGLDREAVDTLVSE